LLGSTFFLSCNLLDVENPNKLTEGSLEDPKSAVAMANGAEASLIRAVVDLYGPYSVASDEFEFVGSRDAWRKIGQGDLNDPFNEYIKSVFNYIAEARYVADNYIERLEQFNQDGTLSSNKPLIRVYLYGAIGRITIADIYDNFVFSNKREFGEPSGENNMDQLYDTAVEYINNALALNPTNNIEAALMGLRARAKFSKQLWAKVNPKGEINTSDPLVNSQGAIDDADTALNLMSPGYRFQLENNPSLNLVPGDQALADHVNNGGQLRVGETYVKPTSNNLLIDSVTFKDPIDDIVEPFLKERINTFTEAKEYANYTMVSAREMYLIKAEVALARGEFGEFAAHINTIRNMYGLTPYNGQISEMDMLIHVRQVYLFL